jgi:uncharacterized protein YndB with AHSA1/START domain
MTDSQRSTRVDLHIRAPRAKVYQLLLDAEALANWRVPDGMAAQVHELDAREGGAIRVSLTYFEPSVQGKTTGGTDLVAVHEGLLPGVSLADNETGWRMALARLAALAEGR